MDSFGAYLRSRREEKGIRLEEIASITKIHLRTLELLEAGRWEKLPPEPFVRGFIVAYGKYIGLDLKELLERYATEVLKKPQSAASSAVATSGDIPAAPREVAGDVIEQGASIPVRKIAGVVGIALLVIVIGGVVYLGKWASTKDLQKTQSEQKQAHTTAKAPSALVSPSPVTANKDQKAADAPPKPATGEKVPPETVAIAPVKAMPEPTKSAPEPAKPTPEALKSASSKPTPDQAKEPSNRKEETGKREAPAEPASASASIDSPALLPASPNQHLVAIEGKERTWIKVVIDEQAAIEYFLSAGEKVSYQAKDKIKVVLGNSTGARVFHNGTLAKGVKFLGTIRSYKFPESARFPQDIPSKRAPSPSPEPET